MMKNAFLTYRPISLDDAEMLLRWRTSPGIGQYMLTEVENNLERQRRWIIACESRTDMVHRIVRIDGADVGYCSIKVTDMIAAIGEIGIYIGETAAPPTFIAYNFIHLLNHAFFAMRLRKIVNHIMATNDRLIPVQKFNGYRHVGVLKEHALKEGRYLDMHIFEQTAKEWSTFRHKFGDWRDLDGGSWPPGSEEIDTPDARRIPGAHMTPVSKSGG